MDLMDIRRGLMMGMMRDELLWKTVVLTDDRKTDAVAIMSKWEEFLGISTLTDLESHTYVAVFTNNTQASYAANLMVWTSVNGSFRRGYIRAGFSTANTNNGSNYANAGTTINIYKLPHI